MLFSLHFLQLPPLANEKMPRLRLGMVLGIATISTVESKLANAAELCYWQMKVLRPIGQHIQPESSVH